MTKSLPHKSRLVAFVEIAFFAFAVASLTYAVATAPGQGIDINAFRNIGLSWIEGVYRIYGPPPFAAVVFSPLAMLSLPQALILCLALNLFATGACIVLVKALFGSTWPFRAVCYLSALLLSWAPYRVTLRAGQISLIVAALLLGSVLSWKRDKRILAGLLMGLSLCKYPLSLPFFLYFVWRKEWKIAATALMVVAGLTLIFSLRLGLSPLQVVLDYVWITGHRSLSNNAHFAGTTEIGPLLFGLTGNESLANGLSIALAALALVSMGLVFRRTPRCEKMHLVIVTFFSLWYVYHRTYDSVICIVPAAFFIDLIVHKTFPAFAVFCLSALGLLAVSVPGLLTERLQLDVETLSANPLGFLGLHIERILVFGLFGSYLPVMRGDHLRKKPILTFLALVLILNTVPSSGRPAERVDIIIRGGTVVTMDGASRVIDNGAVAVKGERIVAVGSAVEIASKYAAARVINAAGNVVMPGLINTHGHVPMVLFRGVADDLVLMDWLQKYIFPAEAKNVDEQFVRWGTRLGCLEMIQGGTTTFVDMYYFEDAIADETARAGMRAVLGETLIDFPAPDNKTWNAGMIYMEKFAARWKGHRLITPAIAPHAAYTVSTDHLKQAHSFAERFGIPLLIHAAEDPAEVKTIQERYGSSTVAYLERIGLLSERVIAAHMIWPTVDDIGTLAKRRVGVAHCPQSNMKLAGGAAPVPQMLKAGVAVGLGTDGAASNNDLSLWEEMDTAAKLHKLTSKDPTVINAREALEMATIRGARAIHQEKEIGSLEAGKRADLIIVGMDSVHQTPLYNVYSHLVYATKASDVQTSIINGRVVMANRRVLTIDERAVRVKASAYRDRVRKSVSGQ